MNMYIYIINVNIRVYVYVYIIYIYIYMRVYSHSDYMILCRPSLREVSAGVGEEKFQW